jgi:hypothetical protein
VRKKENKATQTDVFEVDILQEMLNTLMIIDESESSDSESMSISSMSPDIMQMEMDYNYINNDD